MLKLATFNLCNLGIDVAGSRLQRLADTIVEQLQEPDILGIQEIKAMAPLDASYPVPAAEVFRLLIDAIENRGGPRYHFLEIPPLANGDGGYPGYNIRVGFLFNPRRIVFPQRGSAGPCDAAGIRLIQGQPQLIHNPARIEPSHPAFAGDPNRHWLPSRKPLVGEFRYGNITLFVIVCHLKSMRAATRREEDYTKKQRHAQAEVIHRFATTLLACNPHTPVVIMGDMNDVPGSNTLKILKGDLLINPVETVPKPLRYTCRHVGRPQVLDHIIVGPSLRENTVVSIPHINTDSPSPRQTSDHDPVLIRFAI